LPGAQVAAIDYASADWPAGTRTIVRRMKVKTIAISTDHRASAVGGSRWSCGCRPGRVSAG